MDVTPEMIQRVANMEWTAMSLVGFILVGGVGAMYFLVKKVIPALINYLKEKDEQHITYLKEKDEKHRQDIINLMTAGREERDKFYATLALKLDRIHDRIDVSNAERREEMGDVKDRLGRIETTITHKT